MSALLSVCMSIFPTILVIRASKQKHHQEKHISYAAGQSAGIIQISASTVTSVPMLSVLSKVAILLGKR